MPRYPSPPGAPMPDSALRGAAPSLGAVPPGGEFTMTILQLGQVIDLDVPDPPVVRDLPYRGCPAPVG
jgi:hypothetical protein